MTSSVVASKTSIVPVPVGRHPGAVDVELVVGAWSRSAMLIPWCALVVSVGRYRQGSAGWHGPIDSAQIDIAAPADDVYELVADITNMGRWSPESYKTAWVDGATAAVPGAKFKGWNQRQGPRLPGQVVHDQHHPPGRPGPGLQLRHRPVRRPLDLPVRAHRRRHRLHRHRDPRGHRTRTIAGQASCRCLVELGIRAPAARDGMQVTLERLKAAAETS